MELFMHVFLKALTDTRTITYDDKALGRKIIPFPPEYPFYPHLNELGDISFDYVVTLCSSAAENCPRFPGKSRVIHVGFDDPASAEGTEEERLEAFRRVRGAILEFVENLPWELEHHEETE